ncbi:hypothetical protein KY290_031708 [Solanum tuberosum]|uniref:glutathione transferase n=1 Tax=Solanum tuberosum TaxID=4113 RepID=A0ABQ7UA11_SOLTU|nr:hypothetical protein KY290_031708 [Solanum tuberosum]
MEGTNNVVLLDFWASSFGMRLRIALALKGIQYEGREENLFDKSPLLLKMNSIYSTGRRVWSGKGEDQEEAKKDLIEIFKTLEGELGDKTYFGGDENLGFVDVALVPFSSWFYSNETCANFSIEAECSILVAWAKRCMEIESVSNSLPHPHKIYAYVLELKNKFGLP